MGRSLRLSALLAAVVVLATAVPVGAQSLFDILFGRSLRAPAPRHPVELPRARATAPANPTPSGAGAAPPAAAPVGSMLYCVRLCDGFYFPLTVQDRAVSRTICGQMCPASATDVYRGTTIEISQNERGRVYGALPAALRYRSMRVANCACRPDGAPGLVALSLAEDRTLKRGDIVVLSTGVRVFRGGEAPHRQRDFVSYADASLPRTTVAQLAKIDRLLRPVPTPRPIRTTVVTVGSTGQVVSTTKADGSPREPLRIRIIGPPAPRRRR